MWGIFSEKENNKIIKAVESILVMRPAQTVVNIKQCMFVCVCVFCRCVIFRFFCINRIWQIRLLPWSIRSFQFSLQQFHRTFSTNVRGSLLLLLLWYFLLFKIIENSTHTFVNENNQICFLYVGRFYPYGFLIF